MCIHVTSRLGDQSHKGHILNPLRHTMLLFIIVHVCIVLALLAYSNCMISMHELYRILCSCQCIFSCSLCTIPFPFSLVSQVMIPEHTDNPNSVDWKESTYHLQIDLYFFPSSDLVVDARLFAFRFYLFSLGFILYGINCRVVPSLVYNKLQLRSIILYYYYRQVIYKSCYVSSSQVNKNVLFFMTCVVEQLFSVIIYSLICILYRLYIIASYKCLFFFVCAHEWYTLFSNPCGEIGFTLFYLVWRYGR